VDQVTSNRSLLEPPSQLLTRQAMFDGAAKAIIEIAGQ
jgi:hypothetical protein